MDNALITCCPSVISIEEVRGISCVLTDASSFLHFRHYLSERETVGKMREWHVSDESFALNYHMLQAIVLYEHIVVDSLLYDSDHDIRGAFDLCPDIFRAVYLPCGVRTEIGRRLESLVALDVSLEDVLGLPQEEFQRLRQNDHDHDKYSVTEEVRCRTIPRSLVNDPSVLRFSNGFPLDLPSVLNRSATTVGRAHFYLELARELQIPLAPEPHKARYLSTIVDRMRPINLHGMPERIIDSFDRWVGEAVSMSMERYGLTSVRATIPPVPEYVLGYARKNGLSLLESAIEIRNSKNARSYRAWCKTLSDVTASGRAGRKDLQRILADLDHVCDVWSKDIGEEVDYRTRVITFEKVPMIGDLLKGGGVAEWKVRDPLLTPARPICDLLFLNDLLRPPRSRH